MAKATITKGVDVAYHWRQAGAAGQAAKGAGYYIEAAGGAREAGEPPGRWGGRLAPQLGLESGSEVQERPYFSLFAEHLDPRDGSRLGRGPGKAGAAVDTVFAEMLAAEPHATAERKAEMRIAAAQQARVGPAYFDLTISANKSVSVFHASLGEAARLAWESGDRRRAAEFSGYVAEMDEMIYDAVTAACEYFQDEAGFVRTGHHGARASGRDTGRWEAADLAFAHWFQHTSRDDDPQLHVHTQILHAAKTRGDGKFRAPDSAGYGRAVGAAGAIFSAHLEAAMTRRFGVEWQTRADGLGREVRGISQRVMDLFSTRRATITREVARRAAELAAEHGGQKPSQRVLAQVAEYYALNTRAGKGEGLVDLAALSLTWAARLREKLGIELADIAPAVGTLGDGKGSASRGDESGPALEELDRACSRALAAANDEKPTWTKGDLIRHIYRALPESALRLPPAVAAALPGELADLVLSAPSVVEDEYRRPVSLDAPELEPLPRELRRADGSSIYRRPGATSYATVGQLAAEERLVSQAAQRGAPALGRATAAALLGSDPRELEAALRATSDDAGERVTGSGLRADQAAALFHGLTDDALVSVITGPAGSGKTRVLAEAARMWPGPVLGTATAQAARNVLADAAGVEAYNTAQLLGHTREQRGALGPRDVAGGTLIMVDEGSMVSQADLSDILALARRTGSKVLLTGDQEQLAAVEGGGGMALLADRLGFVQLARAVRFSRAWERAASLRLRGGDAAAVGEYDQHGHILGGRPELVLDELARRYVARYAEGADVLLMAQSHDDCRELSRRIRDDLVHLGYVSPGRAARLRGGARASQGDLIIARHGDHHVVVGDGGRTLANGDTMQVQDVSDDGSLTVRRLVDADPETGERRYSAPFRYGSRQLRETDLAYAVTGHSAQGRTVTHGLALVRGHEARQWVYVALSRARETNTAGVVTTPRLAETAPGPRAAPELARHARAEALREGSDVDPGLDADTTEAAAVLAGCLERDGAGYAAVTVRRSELESANHLAVLRIIWENETGPARDAYWRGLVADELASCGGAKVEAGSYTARWLYRTLETAGLAGQDPRAVLRRAATGSSLKGARDIAAVLDARIRHQHGAMVPQPQATLVPPAPAGMTPGQREYADAMARRMVERRDILGEAAVAQEPTWAVHGLGPVPDDPIERLGWQQQAADVAAYREAYGWQDQAEPIGPEPLRASPRQRAAWFGALEALGAGAAADVRGASDGTLLNMRAQYERETAWAPQYVGDELRHVRAGAEAAHLSAVRARAEVQAAARTDLAARHEHRAADLETLEARYAALTSELERAAGVRAEWDEATERTRRVALAADTEYRRRHPDADAPPLVSAEPEPISADQRAELDTARPGWLDEVARRRDLAADRLDEMRSVMVPAEDPDGEYDGAAWPVPEYQRDAVLQPPRPQLRLAEGLAEPQAETEHEAAT